LVISIDPRGPAAPAGVRIGDIITHWNGTPLTRVRELMRELGAESVGRAAEPRLLRGDAEVVLKVTLGERPAA
jgi:S1-C subfamily serine protease